MTIFQDKVKALRAHHEELLSRKNEPVEWGNGIYEKYKNPILTAEHTPLEWRYDFDEKSNPYLMQRIMMNATLNSGAIKWNGKYLLVVRVEGADRKSFFAVAESPNGVDNFRFWDEPIIMPEDVVPATNIYDMRLTAHEDGYIYGVFCAERHDDDQPGDLSAATATAAIEEKIINARHYHTIQEVKNGEGPHPIKTDKGWLHLAHGVRGCACGLRYVLYMYMTSLEDPTKVIAEPGGYLLVPEGPEYIGDVMNVVFANGWIADEDGKVFIYYASSDTRMHVATSTIDRLVDYCMNTPKDDYRTQFSVEKIKALVAKNKQTLSK